MPGRDISDRVLQSPSLGHFYAIKEGDTLLGVAGRASGAKPGAARLEAARTINDAAYNDRFRGAPTKFFSKGQVSFCPRFTSEPNAQAAVDGPASAGHGYAAIWLAAYPGHEPDLEDEDEDEDVAPHDDPQPEPDEDAPPPIPKDR